jgi:hypothetical protein
VATRSRRYLSLALEALLYDPELLIQAPTPATSGIHNLQPLNSETVLMTGHKDSLTEHLTLRQAALTGGVRFDNRLESHLNPAIHSNPQFQDSL